MKKDTNNSNYSTLINSIYPALLNYSKSKIFNKSDAEDIAQDTIEILVNKQNEFDSSKSFNGWAFKICYYQIKAFLSKRGRNKIDSYDGIESVPPCLLNHTDNTMPFDSCLKQELKMERQKITAKISNNLSPRQKIFFDYMMEGKSMKSIISLMNLKTVSHFYCMRSRTVLSAQNLLKR